MNLMYITLIVLQQAKDVTPIRSSDSNELAGLIGLFVLVLLFALFVVFIIWLVRRSKATATRTVQGPIGTPVRASVESPQRARTGRAGHAIFVSYRRDDSSDVTGRIYDRLVEHFGEEAVYKDVDSIPLGIDFRKHLGDSVGKCNVLLAIIGRAWRAEENRPGGRLSDSRDYVKIEIEAALQRGIPVIPVLVQGAKVPEEEELPPTLQPLAFRNGIAVRADPDFKQDMARLVRGIEEHLNRMIEG